MADRPYSTPKRIDILGVGIHEVIEDEAVDLVDHFVRAGGPHQIVTVNPEFVMMARRDPLFREAINGAALAVPDGVGIIWAGRLLGHPFRGRVTGVELTRRLSRLAAERGYPLYLLGAAPGVAEETAQILQQEYPGLLIAGTFAGSPAEEEEAAIGARIRAVCPQILLVAYGAPRQDLWLRRNLHKLDVPVGIGVGGTFDYLSGRVPRAPAWLRQAGLEWLYRLYRQPWRWRRMLALPHFAWRVLIQSIGRR